jgi:hypothetical protein
MAGIHGALSIVAAAALVAMVGVAAATWTGTLRNRLWLDRAILVQASAAGVSAMAGITVAIATGRLPADGLHVLYGALLVGGPLVGRFAAGAQTPARLGRSMTLIGVVALGIVVRAFLTGG